MATMNDLIGEILAEMPIPEDVDPPEDDETITPFIDIPPADSTLIHYGEAALGSLIGDPLIAARRELLKTKVEAFLR